jgi:hypothetical protein
MLYLTLFPEGMQAHIKPTYQNSGQLLFIQNVAVVYTSLTQN